MSGNLVLDDNGDREPDYIVLDMFSDGKFYSIAQLFNGDNGQRVY